jgi:hypothetical protein
MKQPAWNNNGIGYDTISRPDVSHGFFVENALALLDEENEWYLNTTSETVYYKPPNGTDIRSMYLVLGRLEQLLVVGGTYDRPVHDVTFRGFNYMHSTWSTYEVRTLIEHTNLTIQISHRATSATSTNRPAASSD